MMITAGIRCPRATSGSGHRHRTARSASFGSAPHRPMRFPPPARSANFGSALQRSGRRRRQGSLPPPRSYLFSVAVRAWPSKSKIMFPVTNLIAPVAFQVKKKKKRMTKSKGASGKQKPTSSQKGKMTAGSSGQGNSNRKFGPFCLLVPGESSIPLLDRVIQTAGTAEDIHVADPPPGESSNDPITAMLNDPAKMLLFRLASMVFREIDGGLCFATLKLSNLVVNCDDIVKIKKNVLVPIKNEQQIQDTVRALGNVVDDLVQAASPSYAKNKKKVNPELRHWLHLMATFTPGSSKFLLKYHSCNVPANNRGYYYITMFDHTVDVLRFQDPLVHHGVISGTDIPSTWHPDMATNAILQEYLIRGKYDLAARRKETVPALVPLKCLRHMPSHSREDAGVGDPSQQGGIRFTRADLARAIYHRVPMALCTMAKCLDYAGELSNLGIQELFPGNQQDQN